jgi:hypothetical protein
VAQAASASQLAKQRVSEIVLQHVSSATQSSRPSHSAPGPAQSSIAGMQRVPFTASAQHCWSGPHVSASHAIETAGALRQRPLKQSWPSGHPALSRHLNAVPS